MKEYTLNNGATFKYYTPKELKAHLDEYVIGQEDAKKTIATAMYNHEKRVLLSFIKPDVKIDKSNILMAGPTGCGKTYMITKLAQFMNFPYYIADCTNMTQAGYVGSDIESCLSGLLAASGWNVFMAEQGIVILDEVDKIAKKGESMNISRDVVGEGVQQGFLKMLEGDNVGVPPQGGRKHPEQPLQYINTTNILFVGMGAFVNLENIVNSRMNVRKIGYCVNVDKKDDVNDESFDAYAHMSQEDLIKFGMIPEFIGRFPILTSVKQLSKDDLMKILTEPKNSIISQYKELFELDNIHIEFENDALEFVSELALEIKTGARGLRSIMEVILNDFVFELTDGDEEKSVVITKTDMIEKCQGRYGSYIKNLNIAA